MGNAPSRPLRFPYGPRSPQSALVGTAPTVQRHPIPNAGDAEVVDRRPGRPGADEAACYVHYVGCDRRLDEWVPVSRLFPPGAVVPCAPGVTGAAGPSPSGSGQGPAAASSSPRPGPAAPPTPPGGEATAAPAGGAASGPGSAATAAAAAPQRLSRRRRGEFADVDHSLALGGGAPLADPLQAGAVPEGAAGRRAWAAAEAEHVRSTAVKNVGAVVMATGGTGPGDGGGLPSYVEMPAWYFSPYPLGALLDRQREADAARAARARSGATASGAVAGSGAGTPASGGKTRGRASSASPEPAGERAPGGGPNPRKPAAYPAAAKEGGKFVVPTTFVTVAPGW